MGNVKIRMEAAVRKKNTKGSYYCTCNSGYELSADKVTCLDVNECKDDPCDSRDQCINSYGAYYCITTDGEVTNVQPLTQEYQKSDPNYLPLGIGICGGCMLALIIVLTVRYFKK